MTLEKFEVIAISFIAFFLFLVATYYFIDSTNNTQLVRECIQNHGPDAPVCVSLSKYVFGAIY